MDRPTGLTNAEAARRLEALGEREPPSSRSVASIVVANVVTPFNAIIGVFFILILSLQLWADAIFGFIAMVNSVIGIRSELKAKRTLDELALLVAPRAKVIRDGRDIELRAEEVVPGDLVRVEPGDQLIADGPVTSSRGLTMDESLLTGESDGIGKAPGDRMMSGSFCVSGSGTYELDAVRGDSYAERLAGEAREFRHPPSPLQQEINRILVATVAVLVPLAALVLFSFNARSVPFVEAAQTATAGLVTLVPEGLVLLMSVTFALAAQRLARRDTLVQQIAATEALASVDTICVDKTGTLTDGSLELVAVLSPDGAAAGSVERALGRFAASAGERNRTLEVIGEHHPAPAEPVTAEVPFSSKWKWSGLTLGGPDPRSYVLGAPDVLAEAGALVLPGELAAALREHTHAGRRVVAFGRVDRLPSDPAVESPPRIDPVALVVLSERLRPDARETVEFMRSQAVDLKLISGDARETVTAVAAAVGVPPDAGVIEGSRLPTERHELARAAEQNTVFCRITPEQKKTLVAALSERGRFTAMIGDGVNDVPALKSAKLAVAMGSGAQITKGIADIVLLKDAFSMLPKAVAEGRRIARNIHRLGRLYLTKSVYAGVLIALTAVLGFTFPFLPRHLTVAALLTIGIPSFLLAILPSEGPLYRGRLLRSLSAFAFPAGIASAIASLVSFGLVDSVFGGSIESGRTAATTTLVVLGLAFILLLERGPGREHITIQSYMLALVMGLGALYAGILAIEPVRHFFELEILSGGQWFLSLASAAGGLVVAALGWRLPFVERLEVPDSERPDPGAVPEPTHRPARPSSEAGRGNGSTAPTERMAEGRSDPYG